MADSQDQILFYGLKKCLARPELNTVMKIKIISILHENYERTQHAEPSVFNPLGIDEDLFSQSEVLTCEQIDDLKGLVLEEVRKYHRFCMSLKTKVSSIRPQRNVPSQIDDLYKDLLQQKQNVEGNYILLKKLEDMSSTDLTHVIEKIMDRAKRLLGEERALMIEVDKAITNGDRGKALEEVEKILEQKVIENEKEILKLQDQISDYSI